MHFGDTLTELVAILAIATVMGIIAARLKQPIIIGLIATGMLVGPSGLHWMRSAEQVHLLAEIGLTILLFVVGLRLDVGMLRSMGKTALLVGGGQVLFTTLGGFLLSLALGLPMLTSAYVAVCLTFSSTIIIVKLLSDKGDTDSLYGRITLGVLIVQDLVVVLLMIFLSAFSGKSTDSLGVTFALIVVKGALMLAVVVFLTSKVLPRALQRMAKDAELLTVFAVTWALALATISNSLGFSKEVGAFLAGISLASTPYRGMLGARLASLRDFLILFFFLNLGLQLDVSSLSGQLLRAIPLTLFVLLGKPLIMMFLMGRVGYKKRVGFMASTSLAQISEFSLILMALGVSLKHIDASIGGMVTLVALISITASSYSIMRTRSLYQRFAPLLKVFEPKGKVMEDAQELHGDFGPADIIVLGLGRYGAIVCRRMRQMNRDVLGVDYNPDTVKIWHRKGRRAIYGDAGDPEFLSSLPLTTATWVVCAVHDADTNTNLLQGLRDMDYHGIIACTADNTRQAREFHKLGADLVFRPFQDAAEQAVDIMMIKEEEIARQIMDSQILGLNDHYIICGFGRMGQQIAKDLKHSGVPFVVVENNQEQLPRLKELGLLHVVGKASEDEALVKAGITKAKGLVSVMPTDEDNVFVVLTARVLNPKLTIVARSILEENEDKLKRAGADRVISPYILGGRRMAALITKPQVTDFLDMVLHNDQFDMNIGHVVVAPDSPAVNKAIQELDLRGECGVTVLAIRDSDGVHVDTTHSTVLHAGDDMILLGSLKQLQKASEFLGSPLA